MVRALDTAARASRRETRPKSETQETRLPSSQSSAAVVASLDSVDLSQLRYRVRLALGVERLSCLSFPRCLRFLGLLRCEPQRKFQFFNGPNSTEFYRFAEAFLGRDAVRALDESDRTGTSKIQRISINANADRNSSALLELWIAAQLADLATRKTYAELERIAGAAYDEATRTRPETRERDQKDTKRYKQIPKKRPNVRPITGA